MIDPVTTAVLQNRLNAIAEEMGEAMLRTAVDRAILRKLAGPGFLPQAQMRLRRYRTPSSSQVSFRVSIRDSI